MQALGLHARDGARWTLDPAHFVWALGSLCALNRVPFDAELLLRQFPPPYNTDTLVHAARALGFRIKFKALSASQLGTAAFPCGLCWRRSSLREKRGLPGWAW